MFAFSPDTLTPPFTPVASPLAEPLKLTVKGFHYHCRHKFTDDERATVMALAVIATGCYFGEAYAHNFDRFRLSLDDLAWRNDLVRQRCEEGILLGLASFNPEANQGYVFTDIGLRILKKYA